MNHCIVLIEIEWISDELYGGDGSSENKYRELKALFYGKKRREDTVRKSGRTKCRDLERGRLKQRADKEYGFYPSLYGQIAAEIRIKPIGVSAYIHSNFILNGLKPKNKTEKNVLVLRRHAEYAVTLMRNLQVIQYRQEVVQILPDVFYLAFLKLLNQQDFIIQTDDGRQLGQFFIDRFHRHFSIPVNPTRGIRARVRRVGIAVAVDRLAVLINDGRPRRGVDGNGFVDGGLGMDGQVEDGGAAVRGFGVETAAKCGQREGAE